MSAYDKFLASLDYETLLDTIEHCHQQARVYAERGYKPISATCIKEVLRAEAALDKMLLKRGSKGLFVE